MCTCQDSNCDRTDNSHYAEYCPHNKELPNLKQIPLYIGLQGDEWMGKTVIAVTYKSHTNSLPDL